MFLVDMSTRYKHDVNRVYVDKEEPCRKYTRRHINRYRCTARPLESCTSTKSLFSGKRRRPENNVGRWKVCSFLAGQLHFLGKLKDVISGIMGLESRLFYHVVCSEYK